MRRWMLVMGMLACGCGAPGTYLALGTPDAGRVGVVGPLDVRGEVVDASGTTDVATVEDAGDPRDGGIVAASDGGTDAATDAPVDAGNVAVDSGAVVDASDGGADVPSGSDVTTLDSGAEAATPVADASVVDAGAPVDPCDDGNPCTVDLTVAGGCSYIAVPGTCCNWEGATTCDGGIPIAVIEGNPCGSCPPTGNPCVAATCVNEPGAGWLCLGLGTHLPCNAGNPCTTGDYCQSAECFEGLTWVCDGGR